MMPGIVCLSIISQFYLIIVLRNRCREQQIPKCNEIIEKLDPIIQATKLLQTKKTEEHIPTIVEMCYKLR